MINVKGKEDFGSVKGLGIILSVFLLMMISKATNAQTCCSGGVPLSVNIGLPGAEIGAWQFSLNYNYNQLKTLKSGSVELKDRIRKRITQSLLFQTGYTFSNRLSVDFVISYVRQERHIFTTVGVNSTITNGIGDGVILIKYNFLPNSTSTSLLAGVGPKIPIGSTEKLSESGIALPADLQPGSGSWDAIFWGAYSHSLSFRPSMSILATATYKATGVNPNYLGSIAYEFGNELQIIAGIADQFVIGGTLWDPSISIRYRNAQRDKNNNVEIDATGGKWVFIMPGLKYSISPEMSVNLTYELPVYSFVNNTQLTPTQQLSIGIYYKLNK